jgi:hypothetical protein
MKYDVLPAVLAFAALLACKSEETKPESPPAPVTAATTAPVATSATPAPTESAAAARQETRTGLPIPTEGTSKPPSVAEWGAVGEITVRHSTPLNCETKLVREWLRVSCRTGGKGPYLIEGVKLTGGKDHGGIPPFVKKGVASIVTQVKTGMSAEYTFDWGNFTRKLTVAWPNGAPNPTIEFDAPPPT